MRRATLTDVADAAQVSLKTASRVINGVATVHPELRDRVLEAASMLAYRPHRGAATMRSGTSDMVGMVIRDMANIFYSRVAAGAADVAGEQECLVITCSSEGVADQEAKLLEAVFAQRPRGLLITPTATPQPLILAEMALGCAVVAIDEPLVGLDVDSVSFDNYGASREALGAALELGRNRFAILSDTDRLATMPPRIQGAKDALAERGLGVLPEMEIRTAHTDEQAHEAIVGLLSLAEPPDAVFCANNISALAAASEVRARGLDVAIVAFDNFPLSHTLPQPVVLVEHDDREMGRAAARLLFERLTDPGRETHHLTMRTQVRRY
ncbi:LacI family DNA-binding transcriptional regulator [Tessaracoccus lubricantis]|uniref:LacI family DNA-binding transcriptional regulator n=2 Tax=Tessaracoccus lubricantis TaxID=545543 RepID=A0ABP9EZG3_9ACTN